MTDLSRDLKMALTGIQLTVLAVFLVAYGGSNLALPSFGAATLGTLITGYGVVS